MKLCDAKKQSAIKKTHTFHRGRFRSFSYSISSLNVLKSGVIDGFVDMLRRQPWWKTCLKKYFLWSVRKIIVFMEQRIAKNIIVIFAFVFRYTFHEGFDLRIMIKIMQIMQKIFRISVLQWGDGTFTKLLASPSYFMLVFGNIT